MKKIGMLFFLILVSALSGCGPGEPGEREERYLREELVSTFSGALDGEDDVLLSYIDKELKDATIKFSECRGEDKDFCEFELTIEAEKNLSGIGELKDIYSQMASPVSDGGVSKFGGDFRCVWKKTTIKDKEETYILNINPKEEEYAEFNYVLTLGNGDTDTPDVLFKEEREAAEAEIAAEEAKVVSLWDS